MSERSGKVYLVGAGPGAADLMTVRGQGCLRRAQVVLYDDLVSAELLELVPGDAERIYVGKREGRKVLPQEQICRLMLDRARAGKQVVRLKGGDPFVFGRGGEEAEALAAAGVAWELVPGISSAVAAPAFAGIPLTHRDRADGFQVFTGHRAPDTPGPGRRTAVVMMGMRRLADCVQMLRHEGYADDLPAAVIQWGTLPRQRTVTATLAGIAGAASGLSSPAVLVVGRVVELRRQLDWFESRPLFGKRVLVTRARHQAQETCRLLSELGAWPVILPTIALRPPDDPGPLRRAVERLSDYDLLIFTSANAVQATARELSAAGLDSRAFAGPRLCAVGPGTARALEELGLRPDLVPGDHRAEGILDLLPSGRIRGQRILLPRAAVAREVLPETLRQRGAQVDVVAAYVTGLPEDDPQTRPGLLALEAGELDVLTFTSASTAQNLAQLVGPRLAEQCRGKLVAAIGPVTRDACRQVGLEVGVMPDEYTLPALMEALVAHYRAPGR
jgi:uroporphyrinogen III methyltransferase/synthase